MFEPLTDTVACKESAALTARTVPQIRLLLAVNGGHRSLLIPMMRESLEKIPQPGHELTHKKLSF